MSFFRAQERQDLPKDDKLFYIKQRIELKKWLLKSTVLTMSKTKT